VAILVTTGLVGLFDLPITVLEVVLWALALATAWTVFQRVREVRRQVREQAT
jgi:CDP-diacylglycerol--glycerol-3-phosphate 3-phosphatidyltransferase